MEIIKNNEKRPISVLDISHELDSKVNIFTYTQLKQKYDIGKELIDLVSPYNKMIILYEFENTNIGHFIAVIYHPNTKTFYHFDPYGLEPDEELDFHELYLTKLYRAAIRNNYNIFINKFKFQSQKNDIDTCGRWCIIRCRFYDLDQKKFEYFMKNLNLKTLDDFVTFATLHIKKRNIDPRLKYETKPKYIRYY